MRMHKNLVCSSNLGNSECMIKDSRLLILENVIVYLLQIFSTITFSTTAGDSVVKKEYSIWIM